MASDTHDISRDRFMLTGGLAHQGYDWWWHSFTAQDAETGAWSDGRIYVKIPNKSVKLRFWDPDSQTTSALLAY